MGAVELLPTISEDALQRAAMRGAFLMFERWQVSNKDARAMLGNPPERTFYAWKDGKVGRVPEDTLRRIGYLSGIWKALQILYSNPGHADSWLQRANKAFGGQAPVTRMAAGCLTDLAFVRAHLDAARAPW
jgi:hypothetical protein